tara:strand:+ start:847 stop:1488 length:642 start_codon:yes stop_codon:yes gene_type:complete
MYAADLISIYEDAPIENVYDLTCNKRNPLLYHETLYQYISTLVRSHSGSNRIQHLHSWWSTMTRNDKLPKHTHTHNRRERTVSGVVYEQGDKLNLYIKNIGENEQKFETDFARTILFSGTSEHWTDKFTGTKVRRCLAFDYAILDQGSCKCKTEICIRCVHHKFDRLGFQILASSPAEKEIYIKQNLNEILKEGLFKEGPVALSIDKNKYRRL